MDFLSLPDFGVVAFGDFFPDRDLLALEDLGVVFGVGVLSFGDGAGD